MPRRSAAISPSQRHRFAWLVSILERTTILPSSQRAARTAPIGKPSTLVSTAMHPGLSGGSSAVASSHLAHDCSGSQLDALVTQRFSICIAKSFGGCKR